MTEKPEWNDPCYHGHAVGCPHQGEGWWQCQARFDENMAMRCKWINTETTRHAGDHVNTGEDGISFRWSDARAMYPLREAALVNVKPPASGRQVGGDHYRKFKIQPWDIIDEYGLDFYAGNALKYLLRDKTDRLEDLKKARHYLDKLIEIEEAGNGE